MKVAVLLVSRNRPDLVAQTAQLFERSSIEHDLIVVECGTDEDKLSPLCTVRYEDEDFRGKAFGHNVALDWARKTGDYDYYFVVMNDLVYDEGVDPLAKLVEIMEVNPELGILSPSCKDGQYPASGPRSGQSGWRAVTTCDYLSFLMRASTLEQCGFLNHTFRYCWGAIHELSHRLYAQGWVVAYTDEVTYEHLGGTTYGVAGTKSISREEYQRRAKRFAFAYFERTYGPEWDRKFWEAAQQHGIEVNTYMQHRRLWRSGFGREELRRIRAGEPLSTIDPLLVGIEQDIPRWVGERPLKLHLGSGSEPRQGWVNIDANAACAPDIVASVEDLPMFEDGCAATIESCHLFEHLTLTQARTALREWRRILMPGGELCLELPNLARAVELSGTQVDGYDFGMVSMFGYPPLVDQQGNGQVHKWGWTPESLYAELEAAGFENIQRVDTTQKWRKAEKLDACMRLVSQAPGGKRWYIFAWPEYGDDAELDTLFSEFGRAVLGRGDVTFVLRHDAELDGPQDVALARLSAAFERHFDETDDLSIDMLTEPLDHEAWQQLGARVHASLVLGARRPEAPWVVPLVTSAQELSDLTSGATLPASSYSSELEATIAALDPWFYPVEIEGRRVVPGRGTACTSEMLTNRMQRRSEMLVDAVLERVDVQGKSLLDLACNCGYWTSHYARAGATSVFGMEGRQRHVEQARLYWERGGFVDPTQAQFVQGNIADPDHWGAVRAHGPYDVTLCAGILYHVLNYQDVVRWAAEMTRETLILDTRVTRGPEEVIEEPDDLVFNAIEETRVKTVPNLDQLTRLLAEVGFDSEVLPVPFGPELGVQDVDNYATGARVTIVARRVTANIKHSLTSSGTERSSS